MATTPDYPVLGPPRISAAGFTEILRAAGSPAMVEAAAAYQAALTYGVDPAVLLAIFRKESTFGRFGRAASTRSWGNIRNADGSFRAYSSWTAGANDTARLIAIYGRNQIRPGRQTNTVQTLPYVWAPSADGNAPDAYGDQLASWITDWQRRYPATGSGPGVASISASAIVTAVAPVAPSVLAEFLARIGRRESDLVREQDVMPFVQFLQEKRLVPGGSPNLNFIVNLVVLKVRRLVGTPWADIGPAFSQAAQEPFDPFGLGAALGGFADLLGDIAKRGGQAVILAGVVILGLYLLARG